MPIASESDFFDEKLARRDFIQYSAVIAGGLMLSPLLANAHQAGKK